MVSVYSRPPITLATMKFFGSTQRRIIDMVRAHGRFEPTTAGQKQSALRLHEHGVLARDGKGYVFSVAYQEIIDGRNRD